MKLKDVLSVFLLLDKRRKVEDAEQFIRSVLGYIQTIDFEPQLSQLVATIAEGLLENANAPRHIIEKVVGEIAKGRTPTMFEGLLEAFEEKNAQIEKAYEEKERAYEEKERAYEEKERAYEEKELLAQTLAEKEEVLAEKEEEKERAVKRLYAKGLSVKDIAEALDLPSDKVIEITKYLG
jgi:DNA-binding NarL/FixJ family response regulator